MEPESRRILLMMHYCERCEEAEETEDERLPQGWGQVTYVGASGFRFSEKLCEECMKKYLRGLKHVPR